MSPVLVIVVQVCRHQPFEMALIQDNHVVQQVASASSKVCQLIGKVSTCGWRIVNSRMIPLDSPSYYDSATRNLAVLF